MIYLGEGRVFHSRKPSERRAFKYPAFFLFFRCSEEPRLQSLLREKFFLFFSLSSRDYLRGTGDGFLKDIRFFVKNNFNYEADDVWLHTLPKMFGYAFNPVSFWIFKRQDVVEAVLVEVNNTFQQRHFYWIHPDESIVSDTWLRAKKVFHVSPFFPVDGYYKFRFQLEPKAVKMEIHHHGPDEELRLVTWIEGQLSALENSSKTRLFFKYGWLTALVTLRIHWQAAILWWRNYRFFKLPQLPTNDITPGESIRRGSSGSEHRSAD